MWILAMIEAKFHLSQEQPEVLFEAAVVEFEAAFGKAPEVLDAVDVRLAIDKPVQMIDPLMAKALRCRPR
jgi:hypothetical protein